MQPINWMLSNANSAMEDGWFRESDGSLGPPVRALLVFIRVPPAEQPGNTGKGSASLCPGWKEKFQCCQLSMFHAISNSPSCVICFLCMAEKNTKMLRLAQQYCQLTKLTLSGSKPLTDQPLVITQHGCHRLDAYEFVVIHATMGICVLAFESLDWSPSPKTNYPPSICRSFLGLTIANLHGSRRKYQSVPVKIPCLLFKSPFLLFVVFR